MDKKLTTAVGIALGASLIAGAGIGLYKYFSKKSPQSPDNPSVTTGSTASHVGNLISGYISNTLIKSNSLYGGSSVGNGLIGGGLVKA